MMDQISMGLRSKSSALESEFFSHFALKIISVICINHIDNVAEIGINHWLKFLGGISIDIFFAYLVLHNDQFHRMSFDKKKSNT